MERGDDGNEVKGVWRRVRWEWEGGRELLGLRGGGFF